MVRPVTTPPTIWIGELARRTGLTQQAIRAWETRFGFPAPARSEGGRRQYAEADVDRILRVVALKDSGVRLASAVARVRSEEQEGRPLSVYAELRRSHPHLESRVLRRRVLVAISHAIEDEAMSRAARPHVFGAFQREEFYRAASRRWQEIARTASSCLVFADFADASGGPGGPIEVPLDPEAPLLREWAVVVVAPALSVALTAWEIPRQHDVPVDQREFESVFTFDPDAVRAAAGTCLAAAQASGEVDTMLLKSIHDSLVVEPSAGAAVDALVVRAFDYLQHLD
jgi:DICT domain-containing protein